MWIFEFIANTEGTLALLLRIVGARAISRFILRRRAMIKGAGFRFFAARAALQREFPYLGARFDGVSEVDAIWVLGQKFYAESQNTHVVKRLILPDPESQSFLFFAKSVDQKAHKQIIKETRRKAQNAGAKVLYCPHFLTNSIVLADTRKSTGWAHVEIVLPQSRSNERPGFTIEKQRFPNTVDELQRAFNELWHELSALHRKPS